MYVFLKNSIGLSIKKLYNSLICADRIDIITNSAALTNGVIKRVHCNKLFHETFRIIKDYCNNDESDSTLITYFYNLRSLGYQQELL